MKTRSLQWEARVCSLQWEARVCSLVLLIYDLYKTDYNDEIKY